MAIYKNNNGNKKGEVSYNVGIVRGIVSLAVEDVSGVAISHRKKLDTNKDSIKVAFSEKGLNVEVRVEIYYGHCVPDVAYNIQQSIKHSVESMSKYKINTVNVKVTGVIFPEDNIID